MTSPRDRALDFYFDFISPYAYLAFTQLPALRQRTGAVIRYQPVLFAGLLGAHGQLGPAEIPAKRAWVGANIMRIAARLGVPLDAPLHHPFNPLLALRAVEALDDQGERERAAGAIYAAVWAERKHVAEADVLAGVLDDAGFDGARVVERTRDDAVKGALRAATDRAIAGGVFGVPTFVVGGIGGVFWGCDDLDNVERALRGDDPLGQPAVAARLARWLEITPSATRKR
ncbi:MAG: 2-hydroxychromene-2-carboxylate isomerase [Myxococcales bacterium]|nr:2-hydroxychromene-2-carboxylate isomerase [Myxococcales bacterium]